MPTPVLRTPYSVLRIIFFLISCFLFALRANAVPPATQDPEHIAPYYAFPLTSKDTADQWDTPSKMSDDFYRGAKPEKVDRGKLLPTLIGPEEYANLLKKFGNNNRILIAPKRNISFAIDDQIYNLLMSDGSDTTVIKGLASYLGSLTKNAESFPSVYASTCHYLGYDSAYECAKELYMTFRNPMATAGYSLNRMMMGNWYSKLTTVPFQTRALYQEARKTKLGSPAGAGNIMHSGNIHCMTPTCATSNLEFANDWVLNVLPKEGISALDMSPQLLFKTTAFQGLAESESFALVFMIDPATLAPIEKMLYYAGIKFPPVVIRGTIPGLPRLAEMIKLKTKMLSPLNKGGSINSNFVPVRPKPPDGDTFEDRAVNLIKTTIGNSCGDDMGYPQTKGGNSTNHVTKPFGEIVFDFLINGAPYDPIPAETMPVYCGFAVWPRELIAIQDLFGSAPDSIPRKFYPLAYKDNFTKAMKVNARLFMPSMDVKNVKNAPAQTPVCTFEERLDRSTGQMITVKICEKIQIVYRKGTELTSPGGNPEVKAINLNHIALTTLTGKERWDSCDYYENIESAFNSNPAKQGLIAAVGGGLGTILKIADLGLPEAGKDSKRTDCLFYKRNDIGRATPGGDICVVADKYGIPCCQLKGVIETETRAISDPSQTGGSGGCTTPSGKNFNCCSGDVCGPAQVMCSQYDMWDGGDNLDMCDPVGAAELLARAMILKQCQAQETGGRCDDSYNWKANGQYAMSKYSPITDYNAAAYYYGISNGCAVTPCSQYRWGAGKSYCDSVEMYCNTFDSPNPQTLEDNQDMSFCNACNDEITRVGQPPLSCQ